MCKGKSPPETGLERPSFHHITQFMVLENIKKKQEESAAQAKERMAELDKKFQKTAKKYGLDLSREERIMKQEERHLGFLKQYLKDAEDKDQTQEIDTWKAELDSRLKLTKDQIIQWWNDHHPDI